MRARVYKGEMLVALRVYVGTARIKREAKLFIEEVEQPLRGGPLECFRGKVNTLIMEIGWRNEGLNRSALTLTRAPFHNALGLRSVPA